MGFVDKVNVSEWVSLGHPDKMADYISCYLLDRYIERDPKTRFAVEVLVKDNIVTLAGEVSSEADFSDDELSAFVRQAVNAIGYTREYQDRWGRWNTICGDHMEVYPLLGRQSPDIGQGVDHDAWGDQGIFFGMAVDSPGHADMPVDFMLAKRAGMYLYESGVCGIDIKTMVCVAGDAVANVVVAAPIPEDGKGLDEVRQMVADSTGCHDIVVNGTGRYVRHSSIADCGVTGRKLAVDLYGGNCRIGGGSPWTKDGTKADLTLNIHARRLALDYRRRNNLPVVYTALDCAIGSPVVGVQYLDGCGRILYVDALEIRPSELIREYGLDRPRYAEMCRYGLFVGLENTVTQ